MPHGHAGPQHVWATQHHGIVGGHQLARFTDMAGHPNYQHGGQFNPQVHTHPFAMHQHHHHHMGQGAEQGANMVGLLLENAARRCEVKDLKKLCEAGFDCV